MSPRFPLSLVTAAFLAAGSAGLAAEVDLSQASKLVVEKTNDFREENDLEPVTTDESLQKTAKKFADFMAETGKYGHRADGRTPAERATAVGYDYCVVRENIAYRTDPDDLDAAFLGDFFTEAWIDSPEHRENMLAEYVTETGVAMSTTDGKTYYAVQLFGRPNSAAVQITVSNPTKSTWNLRVESNGGSDEIEMSPRLRVRMKRCFPTTLSLAESGTKLEIKESSEVTIESEDEEPTLTRVSTE